MEQARKYVREGGEGRPCNWGWRELAKKNRYIPSLRLFCDRAKGDGRSYLLQVYRSKTNTSLHFVGVRDGNIYDGDDVKPLSPFSFHELGGITKIVNAHCWYIPKVEVHASALSSIVQKKMSGSYPDGFGPDGFLTTELSASSSVYFGSSQCVTTCPRNVGEQHVSKGLTLETVGRAFGLNSLIDDSAFDTAVSLAHSCENHILKLQLKFVKPVLSL